MGKAADISEPARELEHLIADLSGSGPLVSVFGGGFCTAHLAGATVPVFGGLADRRWWHVTLDGPGCLNYQDHRREERRAATRAATPMNGPGLTATT